MRGLFAARAANRYTERWRLMIRGISLRGAIGLNVITMIGIGPLITIPLVLQKLAGPLALAGWILGAAVALCDGLVWAELGSQYPRAGGTYAYVREIFGARGPGGMLAFLFNWQYVLSASLIISSGYIGFAQYAAYLYAPLAADWWFTHAVAFGIGAVTIALVYRRVSAVSATGVALAVCAIATVAIVGIAGFWHGHPAQAFRSTGLGAHGSFTLGFLAALGGALYITLYDYTGYAQIALAGEELQRPHRTLPFSIVASILIVLTIYLFLQVGVLSAIPWQSLFDTNGDPTAQSQFVGSTVVAHAWGTAAAVAVTVLILVTAFASLYGNLAGAARVPFAAARDNAFLPIFSRLHPRGRFPHVAVLGIGTISLIGSMFTLDAVIAALTAAAVLGGSIPQIAALVVMRSRGIRAPFRMWLYPLPALIALAGWILAFAGTGRQAMLLGTGWLAAGAGIFLLLARRARAWPFAALALVLALACGAQPAQAAPKPAFLYGAAFFYERMPRSQWQPALRAYRALGINTIDLYVMWNWHELADGDFDFTGRTNTRRDLRGLLKLIHDEGFALILRPGPVIRNEWRNGGYPAWLLRRPEYNMPLRDILEGRYPATATFQNAHSDAAAAEWMANATHMRSAARWLQRVYALVKPYRSDILAIALDDDQGAYIDNDTWPGKHFHEYMHALQRIANRALSGIPTFINTYQMKVTASAPVWAWGNWYQSDTYSIGEHDRTQIEFSTGLLQTQFPSRPVMISEFQAGWLQGADEARPRAADPSNTTLALHSFLQMGAHGVVNFPVQDTFNPPGWEAPWANAFYSWDAALSVELTPQARAAPVRAFGALIARYGDALARTHPAADAAIVYTTSAYVPGSLSNSDVLRIAAATQSAQQSCRAARLTCGLVDLRYASPALLARYPVLIVPDAGIAAPFDAPVQLRLETYRTGGGRVVPGVTAVQIDSPHAGGIPNAVLLVSNDERFAFLDVVNYESRGVRTAGARVFAGHFAARIPPLGIPARSGVLIPLGILHTAPTALRPIPAAAQGEHIPLRDGSWVRSLDESVRLQAGRLRLYVSPCAGARAFVLEDLRRHDNLLGTTGAMRDGWDPQLPPSPRDYIGKYTHPLAAGTFNRCYAVTRTANGVSFSYVAPDVRAGGARFTKKLRLTADGLSEEIFTALRGPQRAQQIWSIAAGPGTAILRTGNAAGFFQARRNRVFVVSWPCGVVSAHLEPHPGNVLLRVIFGAGGSGVVRAAVLPARSARDANSWLVRVARRTCPPGPSR